MPALFDWPVVHDSDPDDDGPEMGVRAQYTQAIEDLHEQLQRSRRKYRWIVAVVFLLMGLTVALGLKLGPLRDEGRMADAHQNVLMGLVIVLVVVLFARHDARYGIKRRMAIAQQVIEVLDEDRGHEEVAEESVDLDSLLKTNRSLLKQYHSISTEQAQEAFKMAKLVVAVAAGVFLFGCLLALQGEKVIGVSLAGAAVLASGVGGWVARTFLESYRISVSQAEAYFREPMVQGYLLAAHQIAQKMETPSARDEGLSRVMDGFLAAGLECARSRSAIAPGTHSEV